MKQPEYIIPSLQILTHKDYADKGTYFIADVGLVQLAQRVSISGESLVDVIFLNLVF